MIEMEELKVFVSERLHAAASEILGVIDRTVTDYEQRASRLKAENDRHRSLLDTLFKTQLPQTEASQATDKPPVSSPAAASPLASDSRPTRKASSSYYSDMQCAFTSRTDFLKFAANRRCPYCLKEVQATQAHLMRKHYRLALHFTDNGTENFVISCMCKDRIQDRSHWHCPCCKKILHRRCNFEMHLSKQHGCTIIQENQNAESDQPTVPEVVVSLSPEPWCQELELSMDQEDQQRSLLLQVKEEKHETQRPVSHLESQNSEQLQAKGNSQMGEQSLEAESAPNIVCVDSYSQYQCKINSVENGRGHLPNPSTEPPDAQSDSEDTEDSENSENGSSDKIEERKTNKCVKRSLPPLSSNVKKSTQLPFRQISTASHLCKACGKSFNSVYMLRTHTQTHAVDKIQICGICGKHLEPTASLVQHLQSHTKRNKCGICGKQFSTNSRLKQHKRFHRPEGLNVMSSA